MKSLTPFPEVIEMMSNQLEWTQKLGDAVLAQEADVMDQIQHLRDMADEAGNLETNEWQKISKVTVLEASGPRKVISIEPENPEIVYVPVYKPTVVYGSWWYPAYPPYYWPPPRGGAFVAGFFWGLGATKIPRLWGWGRCNWTDRYINIDVNKYNKINVNRPKIASNRWEHNAYHLRGVKYNNSRVRHRHAKSNIRAGREKRLDYRGHSGKQVLKSRDGGRRPLARPNPGERPKIRDRRPSDGLNGLKRPDKRPSIGSRKRLLISDKKRPPTGAKRRPSTGATTQPSPKLRGGLRRGLGTGKATTFSQNRQRGRQPAGMQVGAGQVCAGAAVAGAVAEDAGASTASIRYRILNMSTN